MQHLGLELSMPALSLSLKTLNIMLGRDWLLGMYLYSASCDAALIFDWAHNYLLNTTNDNEWEGFAIDFSET